jgi:hypothetical protein
VLESADSLSLAAAEADRRGERLVDATTALRKSRRLLLKESLRWGDEEISNATRGARVGRSCSNSREADLCSLPRCCRRNN